MTNILIAGVGGQGTVLASKLIAAAALQCGYHVRTTETIGMAQRGGSVVSHVRIGEDIFSPLIPLDGAQVLIAFEPAEAARCLPYLSEGGKLIVCDSSVKPVAGPKAGQPYEASVITGYLRAHVPGAVVVDGRPLKERCPKTLNVAILGAAAQGGFFPFEAEALKAVIPDMLPQRFWALDLASFDFGREIYDEAIGRH